MRNATDLWVTNTRLTSSQLYRDPSTRGTCGNVSGSTRKKPHLILCPGLEKHENKDHQGQAAELAQLGMDVAVSPLEWERNLLDENTGAIYADCHERKLETNLQECPPFWFALVQFWCNIVNKSGKEERKYEASDTNPRDAQCPDEGMRHTSIKEKSLCKIGVEVPASL